MKPSSVLILGGGGFLGNALAEHLYHQGWLVHIVSQRTPGNSRPNMLYHQGSLEDKTLLEAILPECTVVVHLASGTTPGASAGKPLLEADMNVVPTLKFLENFRNCGNQRMIFVSSGGTLYGNPESIPVNENHTLRALSYHGAGKIAIEAFLQAFAHDSGKKITILRPSNFYGPRQSLRQGFGFIRTVLEHLRVNTEMEIWGDGSTIRDFLYILDMTKSIEVVINAEPHSDVYNVGYGRGYSLNEVIKAVEMVCGRTLKVRYMPERRIDVQKVVLDCSKIREKLGWKPEISLEEGIGLMWRWMLHQ